MRLVFFGSGAFGLPTLEHLTRTHQVLAVVTQPDKPAGRGGRVSPTPIALWAERHLPGALLLKPPKVNDPEVVRLIRDLKADAWVVIAFGQKLGRSLLDGVFAINLHASLLPRWRGAAPINAAILAGDTVTGNSVITLADRMDAGLVLGRSSRPIDPLITAGELHDLLAQDGPALIGDVLARHATGTLYPETQDESQVTIATKLSKNDDAVDFAANADFVRRQVHALTPWPGVSVAIRPPAEAGVHRPPQPLKLLRVQAISEPRTPAAPGTLIDPHRGRVACGHNTTLQLLDVQPPGKRPMPWDAFARGRSIPPGSTLTPARELV